MKLFTSSICQRQIQNCAATAIAFLIFSGSASAQFRNYTSAYSADIQGSTTIFGNTLEAICLSNNVTIDTAEMNDTRNHNGNSSYLNDNSNMQFVDIDGSTGYGAVTKNSSSADLSLPSGTNTIKFARLYWAGRVLKSTHNVTNLASDSVKIRFGSTSADSNVLANHVDDTLTGSGSSAYYQYQAYADVTQFVQSNGSGTYFVGNVPLTPAALVVEAITAVGISGCI